MRKITMWMVLMAMAVSPLVAQEVEPSDTEQQQIDQAIDEAIGDEQVEQVMEEPMEEPVMEEPVMEEPRDRDQNQNREVQTLMSGGGGYGAFSVGYTEVNGLPAFQMGLSAEWVIGHSLGLGIAGRGFTSDFTPVGEDFYAMSGGYGGLIIEPIVLGWLPVHVAFPVLIGGGGMASYVTTADLWDYDNIDPYFGEYTVFFVGEVGMEIEFNLVKFFRLAMFGTYRWTPVLNMKSMYGLEEPSPEGYTVSGDALNGWSAGVRLKFGSF